MALRRRGILGQSQGRGRASWSAAARLGQALKEPSADPLRRRALTTCPQFRPLGEDQAPANNHEGDGGGGWEEKSESSKMGRLPPAGTKVAPAPRLASLRKVALTWGKHSARQEGEGR